MGVTLQLCEGIHGQSSHMHQICSDDFGLPYKQILSEDLSVNSLSQPGKRHQ